MPQSEEDMHKYHLEKIRHIEDQIRNIDAHIRELEAFELAQMKRNMPKEYKTAMHFALHKAKTDANAMKNKANLAVSDLKGRVNTYLQTHNKRV
jgi:TolA-binding protein